MEDALEDYIPVESRGEEWWSDLQRDIDEIHSLLSENDLSEPWQRGRTSSPKENKCREESLDENNNENTRAHSRLSKLEPSPTYRLPELSPRALRRKGESWSRLDYSGEGERSEDETTPLEKLEEKKSRKKETKGEIKTPPEVILESDMCANAALRPITRYREGRDEETNAKARMIPATTDDDRKKLGDLVQNAESGAAVRREEEVRVQSNEVLEPGERLRSWSESQAVGRVHADLRTQIGGPRTSRNCSLVNIFTVKAKGMFNFRSEPTVIGHWPQIEEEAARLSYGTSGSLTSENESSAGSGIFSYNVGIGATLTRRTLSAQQPEPPRETSNDETLNDAIRTGSDSFTKKSDRVRRRWTSSLTNVLLFLRGKSKRSQEERQESLGRSHRKTKWKEKFTEPWKMWEKRVTARIRKTGLHSLAEIEDETV